MAEANSESLPSPIVVTDKCFIRAYSRDDAEAMAAAANLWEIVRYMRDSFPFPYTIDNAHSWIDQALKNKPTVDFGIYSLDGHFIGSIGLKPGSDVEYRTWELGYWIGKDYWGKGIATTAAKAFSAWAFEEFPDIFRLEARVFGGNAASMKVLERAGYSIEGVRRKAICKKGEIIDQMTYSLLREELKGLN